MLCACNFGAGGADTERPLHLLAGQSSWISPCSVRALAYQTLRRRNCTHVHTGAHTQQIQNWNLKCVSLTRGHKFFLILPDPAEFTVWNDGLHGYESVFWASIPKCVLLDTHASPFELLTTSDRTYCVFFTTLCSYRRLGRTVRQHWVLVDQSSRLYDLLGTLPHFLKNSDCPTLSALSTEVNWNLALGDIFLLCFLSLKKATQWRK